MKTRLDLWLLCDILLIVGGATLVIVGVWRWSGPAAQIVAGLVMIGLGLLRGR